MYLSDTTRGIRFLALAFQGVVATWCAWLESDSGPLQALCALSAEMPL